MPFEKDSGQKLRAGLRRVLDPHWRGLPRRTSPLSRQWGAERGTPIDRYYIARFLETNQEAIRGRVLEIGEDTYTRRFGSGVEGVEVLDSDRKNSRATIFADLAKADALAADSFDCFILTQTLHAIYDCRAALRHAHRVLKPGGVLLATLPVVSRLCEDDGFEDCWRFTPRCVERMFGEVFNPRQVQVTSYGNVLTASAFLYGLAQEELTAAELDFSDPLFPLLVCVRANKS